MQFKKSPSGHSYGMKYSEDSAEQKSVMWGEAANPGTVLPGEENAQRDLITAMV